jgi:amidase
VLAVSTAWTSREIIGLVVAGGIVTLAVESIPKRAPITAGVAVPWGEVSSARCAFWGDRGCRPRAVDLFVFRQGWDVCVRQRVGDCAVSLRRSGGTAPAIIRSAANNATIHCRVHQARKIETALEDSVRFLLSALLLFATLFAAAQNVVHYTTTTANVKYLFATAEPVLHLKAGDILDTNTLDCFGNGLKKPGDTLRMATGDNPLAGPFYVEGAEPGDTLAVKILDLQVDGDTGVGAFAPGFGAINETNYTPMLHAPLPERVWFYHIDHAANTATFKALDSDFSVKIPVHPFFGCIGVAPANGEARSSVVPAEFGGNMDSPEASVGNTVYFPVNVKGGLLYIGDGHAAMGDGEIAGTAIEVPLKARVQLSVIKGRSISWPQFENDDAIMTVGAYRPVDDAVRIAFTELVHWIHKDYGLSELDAYELLSKVAKIHLNEMVDPNYVVVASVEKKYLPAKKKP